MKKNSCVMFWHRSFFTADKCGDRSFDKLTASFRSAFWKSWKNKRDCWTPESLRFQRPADPWMLEAGQPYRIFSSEWTARGKCPSASGKAGWSGWHDNRRPGPFPRRWSVRRDDSAHREWHWTEEIQKCLFGFQGRKNVISVESIDHFAEQGFWSFRIKAVNTERKMDQFEEICFMTADLKMAEIFVIRIRYRCWKGLQCIGRKQV